jgi:hypothetical protein
MRLRRTESMVPIDMAMARDFVIMTPMRLARRA